MQAQEEYIGSKLSLQICVRERHTRELQDVLSRHLPSFYRKAYRDLGNAADAEDAVQDALLLAYKHLDQFKGQAQLSTWLTAIVTNSARMQLRRRPRQIHLSLDEKFGDGQAPPLAEQVADEGPGPEEECRASELRGRLNEFVGQLSPRLRRTFQLRELDGLSTSETARILGVPHGTVKVQLARARTKVVRLMRRALNVKAHAPRATLVCDLQRRSK